MGMAHGPRTMAIEFNATSPGAKRFAEALKEFCEENAPGDDWYVTADFSVPEGWDRFRPAPTISIDR